MYRIIILIDEQIHIGGKAIADTGSNYTAAKEKEAKEK